MIKIKTVVSLLVLFSFLSFTSALQTKTGTSRGDKMKTTPEIEKVLEASSGSFVLIHFWASHNANSRIENIKFARLMEKYKEKQFENAQGVSLLSLSFDEYQSVFAETVKRDQLNEAKAMRIETASLAETEKTFDVDRIQFGNYLLDAQGVIVAKNITATDLEQLLQQN